MKMHLHSTQILEYIVVVVSDGRPTVPQIRSSFRPETTAVNTESAHFLFIISPPPSSHPPPTCLIAPVPVTL